MSAATLDYKTVLKRHAKIVENDEDKMKGYFVITKVGEGAYG